ncbi:hypothetical protein QT971_30735 [Microcoleus sp. herbarium19]|uniref:hypothetical protein n=1 Tax=unclassified Microcoleus TaxID=2642155 RepID=UPI002FD4106A
MFLSLRCQLSTVNCQRFKLSPLWHENHQTRPTAIVRSPDRLFWRSHFWVDLFKQQ